VSAAEKIEQLVDRFLARRAEYESPMYVEARVRVDFINPFFEALGWDTTNVRGVSEHEREVVTEARLRVGATVKAPDYLFRLGGEPVFMVEAKKPAVNLRDNPGPALQLRRYGWNSGNIGIGLLTDFQELSVYDCRVPPAATDRASVALVNYYRIEDYLPRWQEIEERFSREAVEAGSLNEFSGPVAHRKGKQRVDKVFLRELEQWRQDLALNMARNNKLSEDELNFAVQLTVDRIVFLRVCEDRGLESHGTLLSEAKDSGVYARLIERFRRADEKYNSGLFHFRAETDRGMPDHVTPSLRVDDAILHRFIKRLYWPDGPYAFEVLPPDILGHIYEQFLGKVIKLQRGKATVEEKPEVRKAGGVFYTPTRVVKDIVSTTLGAALKGRTPPQMARSGFTICDPSCGSGSFLIEVYQYLLDWYLEYYISNDPQKWTRTRPVRLERGLGSEWRLTMNERKRILLDHVFGVDIDQQAVEVSKLNLLLKVLEGETSRSLYSQLELFHERALPDLEKNVKCGNSLVGSAFHMSQTTLDNEHERSVNAFDWTIEFPNVAAGRGFDVMVGNPPWLMAGYYVDESVPYMKENFATATGKFDLYYLFVEQCLRLVGDGGTVGLIIPNKFFHTRAALSLRQLLAGSKLSVVKDFGIEKVFEKATNYSCIIIIDNKDMTERVAYAQVGAEMRAVDEFDVPRHELSSRLWSFQDQEGKQIFSAMEAVGVPLESLVDRFATGVQSGSDRLLTFDPASAKALEIERDLLRPVLRGRDVRAFRVSSSPKVLLFPYVEEDGEFRLLRESELRSFPNAWIYLQRHRERLAKRIWFDKGAEDLSGAWYGLMYVEGAKFFARQHVLTPSLSNVSNFAMGSGDLFVTGTAGVTGLSLARSSGLNIRFLLGVLNSSALSVYITQNSPAYQGGYRKFSAPYLKRVPIPTVGSGSGPMSDSYGKIVALVDDILESDARLAGARTPHQRATLERRIEGARAAIDDEVFAMFSLDDRQRSWIARKLR
jgi:type I restriction-modification system DNA methylase subunit